MTATYYPRGHSQRGEAAREAQAVAWSLLSKGLRRGVSSADAVRLGISPEWHHAGKYAARVYVYHPDVVAAFWAVVDGCEVADLLRVAGRDCAPREKEDRAAWLRLDQGRFVAENLWREIVDSA